ncbi:hypothetical protein NXS19_008418 [Fusarium pseudograminearum]|uniref:U6 snRNA phosphodiesterase n=1 Tax=Fusarium pseudograminearum (strain CS3096) TaxID=1028729 RepID=K3W1F2_FUSPC|nr:hypothetical protein FPSE_03975 [Fusarium pseudograminearum CS3096]EKJ75795.1 hypothetical protein FPSE_03975 [Fusarium pseudograminearum CS3096]KAF0642246.1 hypothetical protein FPSE5266_03975 [Fusarium pseudograminearum]UZP40602.1 hypothetical protein NXS19_008418 [Fusarium pseudograminearum]
MALVDYSSSGSDSEPDTQPVKRRKAVDGSSRSTDGDSAAGASSMPPLPDTFHDLYASTVRQSVVDDPSLHQGRKRHIPHVVGNWPSHVYTEWHPSTEQHGLLTTLIADIEEQVSSDTKLFNFLTSDLGSPLPLHISLSRPLSLTTSAKDEFLDKITESFNSSGIAPFTVKPQSLAWFRSPDSDRTFLILRVASGPDTKPLNPELTSLLLRSNSVAAQFGLPSLYARSPDEPVGGAFHVSIGWTFHLPGDDMSLKTLRLFKQSKFDDIRKLEISVPGVKVKIGNVVNHIALKTGRSGAPKSTSFLKS